MPTKTHSIDASLRKQGVHSIDAQIFLTLSGASELTLYYTNKNPQDVSNVAQYVTQFEDLESNKWKHIKHVDAIGDYGNNVIKLSWSITPNYSLWNPYQIRTPSTLPDQATRWHNLGQARRMAYKVRWIGDSQINHEALEISYNIRTQ
jgi:hypothetical protein